MAWLPRSLRGRTLLLTVVGIIACEGVTFAILGIYRHALLAGRARDFVGGQVDMVRRALTHATPEEVAEELDSPPRLGQRERRARRYLGGSRDTADAPPRLEAPPSPRIDERRDPSSDQAPNDLDPRPPPGQADPPQGIRARDHGRLKGGPRMRLVATLPANATTTEPADLSLPQVVTALRDEYGRDALRFTDEPEPAVWLRMPGVDWWLMLPFARYSAPPVPWPVLFATLAAVAVMGVLVGLYSFHLSRPLRALSDAAARYKVGLRPELPLSGPAEIRAVTAQFNAMAERLERDDAERRVMLAGLPHDLRAPLSRARLRLELMDDGPDSPKSGLQRDLAEVGKIADQFVAYLRGLDHDTTKFTRLAVHELVRDRGLVWRESGHDVTIERVDPFVREADADALMRAIDNLIGNAFAHGRPPVTLSGIARVEGKRSTYRIVVRDHGPGIPAPERADALKPFTRLDAARGASGHCGLGLAVAQSVARLHGGQIDFADANGKTIAFSTIGGMTYWIAQALVARAGVKAQLVATGGPAATLTQVMSRQIDIGYSVVPFALQDVDDGKLRYLGNGEVFPELGTQTVRCLITNYATLAGRTPALRRFMAAYRDSLDWMYADPRAIGWYAELNGIPPAWPSAPAMSATKGRRPGSAPPSTWPSRCSRRWSCDGSPSR